MLSVKYKNKCEIININIKKHKSAMIKESLWIFYSVYVKVWFILYEKYVNIVI